MHTLLPTSCRTNLRHVTDPRTSLRTTDKRSVQAVVDCSVLRKSTVSGVPWRHPAGFHFGGRLAVVGFGRGHTPRGSSSPCASTPSQAASALTYRKKQHTYTKSNCHQNSAHTHTRAHTRTRPPRPKVDHPSTALGSGDKVEACCDALSFSSFRNRR